MIHIPVLLKEVIRYLNPQPNQNFIDCTIGGGGHAFKILDLTKPNGKLLGIDLSKEAIEKSKIKSLELKIEKRIILINDNFANLAAIVKKENFSPVYGILIDLGLSSDLLETSGRGFSFQKNEVLDMRFNPNFNDLTAQEILNQWPDKNLLKIFKEFGEEKFSQKIVRSILEFRKKEKIQTTQQLVNLIKLALGKKYHIKSVARIFQALRIAVNDELENLKRVLPQAVKILEPRGRLVVIAYHSLEDRIVKQYFKNQPQLKILNKKPIRPTSLETKQNLRSRSAKLRVAEKNSRKK